MKKEKLSLLWVILLPVSLVLLLQGCGTEGVRSYPPERVCPPRPAPPEGGRTPIPDRGRIPATQRPYTIDGKTYYPLPSAYGYDEIGIASWYGPNFHGKATSCGETYNMNGLTAAHKILPMNTRVLVKNLGNGRECVLRVNDRGPFVKDRIIDLSLGAARALGVDGPGTARVQVTALGEAERTIANGKSQERFVAYQDLHEGEFYVQIGAFTNKKNADRLTGKMVAQGRRAVSQLYDQGPGNRYYRVQVWAGRTLDQAKAAERSWEGRYPGAFVIAR
jgi:rare lipoprotein A